LDRKWKTKKEGKKQVTLTKKSDLTKEKENRKQQKKM
jgi:hypothetical protein